MQKKVVKNKKGSYRLKKSLDTDDYVFCVVVVFVTLFFAFQIARYFLGL